jgi:hypothetical protein
MLVRASLRLVTRPAPQIPRESPNGPKLSGDGGEADGVRCSALFGDCWFMGVNLKPAAPHGGRGARLSVPFPGPG